MEFNTLEIRITATIEIRITTNPEPSKQTLNVLKTYAQNKCQLLLTKRQNQDMTKMKNDPEIIKYRGTATLYDTAQ